ncbi:MAG: hypothetical protein U9Q66_03220 [Patescibacteria group bacterium]|nr:hypothetical protein [Patescibacteria group bacterium]
MFFNFSFNSFIYLLFFSFLSFNNHSSIASNLLNLIIFSFEGILSSLESKITLSSFLTFNSTATSDLTFFISSFVSDLTISFFSTNH